MTKKKCDGCNLKVTKYITNYDVYFDSKNNQNKKIKKHFCYHCWHKIEVENGEINFALESKNNNDNKTINKDDKNNCCEQKEVPTSKSNINNNELETKYNIFIHTNKSFSTIHSDFKLKQTKKRKLLFSRK